MSERNGMSRRSFAASAASAAVAVVLAPGIESDAQAGMAKENTGVGTMASLTPYLLFDGCCRDAMEFYRACFGGELTAMQVKDSPARAMMADFQQERILNAHLKSGRIEISASDWLARDAKPAPGNTVSMYLDGGTVAEVQAAFDRLSEGGEVRQSLQQMFFGMYGALTDRFGVRWMFHTSEKA
ncbi:MAG TPA: VOC family protein [Terracidiphilus sp.]|nr:VOC family protein [Terracidiphilus sp.]